MTGRRFPAAFRAACRAFCAVGGAFRAAGRAFCAAGLVCCLMCCLACCGGCRAGENGANGANANGGNGGNDALQIVAANFPAYDCARRLIADCPRFSVRMLLPPGTESHTYDPSVSDVLAIRQSALVVRAGEHADAWLDPLLEAVEQPLRVLAFVDCGMTLYSEDGESAGDASDTGDAGGTGDAGDADHGETDPHVWTDPLNMVRICEKLADALCALPGVTDAERRAIGAARDTYIGELEALDASFVSLFDAVPASRRVLLFGDRFPFRYFTRRYGLTAYAAFPGCAGESEPSASRVAQMIDRIRDMGAAGSTIFYLEFSNHRVADAIAEETGAQTAMLHSCHNVTSEEFRRGETYLSLMTRNLQTLQTLVTGAR